MTEVSPALQGDRRSPPLWLIASLAAVGPFSISLYLPALPALANDLGASAAEGQLTLTLYLAGFAIGQLVYGPVSDRVGRRPVMLAGLVLYVVASLAAAAAAGVATLLIARLAQALGACAGTVVTRAVVRDVTTGPEIARTLAVIAAALALSPALGPAIGGVVAVWVGWRACFLLLAAAGATLLVCTLFGLSETHSTPRSDRLAVAGVVHGYLGLLEDRVFVGFVLTAALISGATYVYNVGAPFVFIAILGLTPDVYGLLGLVTSAGYLVGTLLARRRAALTSATRLTREGALWSATGGLGLLGVASIGPIGAVPLIATMVVFAVGLGILYPTTAAAALARHPEAAGAAAAVIGCAQVSSGMIATAALSLSNPTTATPMALIVALCSILALVNSALR